MDLLALKRKDEFNMGKRKFLNISIRPPRPTFIDELFYRREKKKIESFIDYPSYIDDCEDKSDAITVF